MNILEPLVFIVLIIFIPYLIMRLIDWDVNRKYKYPGEARQERIEAEKYRLNDLFPDNAMFCKDCFLYDYWFTGGGSWSPERCPYHPTSDEVILWKHMTKGQRCHAAWKHDQMWYQKFGNYYFNEDQRTLF